MTGTEVLVFLGGCLGVALYANWFLKEMKA